MVLNKNIERAYGTFSIFSLNNGLKSFDWRKTSLAALAPDLVDIGLVNPILPFFTTKPTGQGTGLGLSLSYDMVKAYSGELNVETLSADEAGKEGGGTQFIIQIPLA